MRTGFFQYVPTRATGWLGWLGPCLGCLGDVWGPFGWVWGEISPHAGAPCGHPPKESAPRAVNGFGRPLKHPTHTFLGTQNCCGDVGRGGVRFTSAWVSSVGAQKPALALVGRQKAVGCRFGSTNGPCGGVSRRCKANSFSVCVLRRHMQWGRWQRPTFCFGLNAFVRKKG